MQSMFLAVKAEEMLLMLGMVLLQTIPQLVTVSDLLLPLNNHSHIG